MQIAKKKNLLKSQKIKEVHFFDKNKKKLLLFNSPFFNVLMPFYDVNELHRRNSTILFNFLLNFKIRFVIWRSTERLHFK